MSPVETTRMGGSWRTSCKRKAEGNWLVQAGGDESGRLAVCSHFMGTQSKSFSGIHSGRM